MIEAINPSIEHDSRRYTAFSGASYMLPSDEVERKRLEAQHTEYRQLYERILFAPVSLQPGDKVLDSGTGSGAWMRDISNSLPSTVELHGTDIESALFPSSHEPNIQFSVASITSLPSEWSNSFALVNQRLLMFALRKEQWPLALQEIHRVLAPGGWVQQIENITRDTGPAVTRMRNVLRSLAASRGIDHDIALKIPELLKETGFVNVTVEERPIKLGKWAGQEGIVQLKTLMGVWRGIKTPILAAGGFGLVNSEAELDRLLDDVENEYMESTDATIRSFAMWAQKPL